MKPKKDERPVLKIVSVEPIEGTAVEYFKKITDSVKDKKLTEKPATVKEFVPELKDMCSHFPDVACFHQEDCDECTLLEQYEAGKKAELKRLWEATQDYIEKRLETKKKLLDKSKKYCGEKSRTYELDLTDYGAWARILPALGTEVFKTIEKVEMYFDDEGLLRRK